MIEQRLARWLLMCHDRIEGDETHLTHDFISMMLGSRRAGVTVALRALENRHLFETKRGSVLILDRLGLEQLAGGVYGVAESKYERLLERPVRDVTPGKAVGLTLSLRLSGK